MIKLWLCSLATPVPTDCLHLTDEHEGHSFTLFKSKHAPWKVWPHLKTQSPPSLIKTILCNGNPQSTQSVTPLLIKDKLSKILFIGVSFMYSSIDSLSSAGIASVSGLRPQCLDFAATMMGSAVFFVFPFSVLRRSLHIWKLIKHLHYFHVEVMS